MKRRFFRISTLFFLVLAVVSGASLYAVSQEVHRAEGELSALRSKIRGEEDAIRTLHAEWNYLNNPVRLEKLARQYFEMEDPATSALLVGVQDLPEAFVPAIPSRKPEGFKEKLRPVQATVPVAPSRLPIPAISPQQSKSGNNEDFNVLLRNLGGGGRG